MIRINCLNCGKGLEAPDEAAGKKGKCYFCKTVFEVPVPRSAGLNNGNSAGVKEQETRMDEQYLKKIVKAIENLEEARRYKSLKGDLNRETALRFQALRSMPPKDVSNNIKKIMKSHDKTSDIFVKKLKTAMDYLNEVRRKVKKDEDIRKEWERLYKGEWKDSRYREAG